MSHHRTGGPESIDPDAFEGKNTKNLMQKKPQKPIKLEDLLYNKLACIVNWCKKGANI